MYGKQATHDLPSHARISLLPHSTDAEIFFKTQAFPVESAIFAGGHGSHPPSSVAISAGPHSSCDGALTIGFVSGSGR